MAPWPDRMRERLALSFRSVFFPNSWNLIDFYEKCSSARLLLHWALPEFDSAIYLDTDHVFMRPPEHLIEHFKSFHDEQVFRMAPAHGYHQAYNVEVNKKIIFLCKLIKNVLTKCIKVLIIFKEVKYF
jgi:hypothetical protein